MAELDIHRQCLLTEVEALEDTQRKFKADRCEFNADHGLMPAAPGPNRLGEVRRHGGAIGHELVGGCPIYDIPVKNMRAQWSALSKLGELKGPAHEA